MDHSRFRSALEKAREDLPKAPSLLDAVEYAHEQIGEGKGAALALIPCAAAYGVPESDLIRLLGFLDVDVAKHWKLNKEFLNCMTKSEIEAIAGELGLNKALKARYAKLAGGKKEDFISALLKVDGFNYTGVVPKVMRYRANTLSPVGAGEIAPAAAAEKNAGDCVAA